MNPLAVCELTIRPYLQAAGGRFQAARVCGCRTGQVERPNRIEMLAMLDRSQNPQLSCNPISVSSPAIQLDQLL